MLASLPRATVNRIRVITLGDLRTSSDGRLIEADLAVEVHLNDSATPLALFHWGVSFGVEQICVWLDPLRTIWPTHRDSPTYEVPKTWAGWPEGRLVEAEGSKLRPSEVGLNAVALRFERGGFRIETSALEGDMVVPDPTSLLLVPMR